MFLFTCFWLLNLLFSVARMDLKMSPPFPESETSKSPSANSLMASSLAEKVMNIAGVKKCRGRILVDYSHCYKQAHKAYKSEFRK